MTSNDPRRRSGDPRKHGTDGLAVVPAGVPASGQAEQIGEAVAAALAQVLPLLTARAFADVLQRVPVRTPQHVCGPCVVAAVRWEQEHAGAIEAARQAQAAAAAEAAAAGSQEPPPGILAFLPAELQPGGQLAQPDVRPAITTISGTEVCHAHLPGQEAPGRRPLLVASSWLTPGMLAEAGGGLAG